MAPATNPSFGMTMTKILTTQYIKLFSLAYGIA